MSPKLFKGIVAGLLVLIALLVIAPFGGGDQLRADQPRLDLATANRALAAAGPGLGIKITGAELSSDDYPSDQAAPGAFAPAPSKAQGMTPEWHKYAAMVDRVCAVSYNYMLASRMEASQFAREHQWTVRRAAAAQWRLTADEDARILQATNVLGPSPAQQALFEKWRDNVRERTGLFRRAGRAAAAGDFAVAQRLCRRIARLKVAADELGRRFGLRICTSN